MARGRAAAVLVLALLAAAERPAFAQEAVGGTIDLRRTPAGRSDVLSRRPAAAVALLRGRPEIAAVGEPGAAGGRGRVRLAELAARGFDATSSAEIRGSDPDARAGAALAAVDQLVGDDGVDLLVGAPHARVPRRGNPGAAFLISGRRDAGRLRLGDRDAVTILGAADGNRAGAAVAAVPDADGDGRPELLVGAPDAGLPGRPGAGAVFLVSSRGLRLGDTIDLADPEAALRIDGPAEGAHAGKAVAGSGDTDGDGAGELIVGAPGLGSDDSGAAYLVRVVPGEPVDLAAGSGRFVTLLGARGERAGTAVVAPGDLNGDGRRDIAVGAPNALVAGRGRTGAVYVLAPPAGPGSYALSELGRRIEGEANRDRAGSRLARAGDAGRSERPDLLIGAPGGDPLRRLSAGAVYIVFGGPAAAGVDLALLGRGGLRLAGEDPGSALGTALAGDVDVNGDSQDDVLVGARANDDKRDAEPTTVLQETPQVATPEAGQRCDTTPGSMVLDASDGLFAADDERLRGSALELLLRHPGTEDRLLAAVEAARRPGEVFLPLARADIGSQSRAELVEGLIAESVSRSYETGDLRQALKAVQRLSPRTESGIVVAGPEAMWSAGPPPPFPTDVVGVEVSPGSVQEATLRSLAASSGGQYAGVGVADLQAQVAHFDANRRCESPLTPTINGRQADPLDVSTLSTPLVPGYDLKADARSPRGTRYVDMVLTWSSPRAKLQPDKLSIDEIGGDGAPEFGRRQLRAAAQGKVVTSDGVRLTGGRGDTFVVLRLNFEREHEATVAKHRPHFIHYGGSSGYGARVAGGTPEVYVQFFARDPD